MDRADVLMSLAVKACQAAAPSLRSEERWKNNVRQLIRIVLGCRVTSAKFSLTDPPYPIVMVAYGTDGSKQTFQVLAGHALEILVGGFSIHADDIVAVRQALVKVLTPDGARIEALVQAAADKLEADPVRLQKALDTIAGIKAHRMSVQRDNLKRELRPLIQAGWTEEDVLGVFREMQVAEVMES